MTAARSRSLAAFRKFVTDGCEKMAAGFTAPDDDWEQALFFQAPEGVGVLPIDGRLMESDAVKDALSAVLVDLVARLGVYRYGLLLNMWAVTTSTPEEFAAYERKKAQGTRNKDIDGAFEQLLLVLGDAEEEQVWVALINRYEDTPPTLAPWARQDDAATTFAGRFIGLNTSLGRRP